MTDTLSNLLMEAMEVQTQEAADACVARMTALHPREQEVEESALEESVRRAIGYFAGYYSHETRLRVERLFRCEHPIFGSAAKGTPSPDEIFRMGMDLAKNRQR